ncbi:MAG: FAD-binding oxidoreductase [Thermomicrobiales bacterium]
MMVSATTSTALPVLDPTAVAALSTGLRGPVVRPGDDGYDAARHVWNGMIDKRPAVIARCAGVADVLAAVAFARDHDLLLAVRGGGHNIAGTGVCDAGLVLDLSPMKGIRVDPGARAVRAEGGVLWQELDSETQAFGLATTGGFISTTGIAGLTLGGGFGWLMRAHGLACDNLISADVVTADGRLVVASAEENPDLFWGLRGGGGNFGVVTSFAYRLHEVGPEVLAGPLFHPLEAARDGLRFLRDATPTMADALSCAAALLTSPEGVPMLGLVPAYIGPIAEGEAAVQPLRAFGSPLADLVAPLPYRTLQQMFDPAFPSGRRSYWKSSFLRGLDDAAIDIMVEHFARVPSPHSAVFLEQFGGAVSRVGSDETAFSHRTAPFNLIVIAGWDDPAQDAANIAWARDLWMAMQPFAAGGVYVNYLGDARDEGAGRVRDAYGAAKYDRLTALKATYDPTNLFRVNQNIAPAG